MAHGRTRDPRKEQQWRRWLRLWQHSGLTVRAFCDQHGLSQPSFYAWRRRLQPHPTAAFVPVQVLPDQLPALSSRNFEIVLADGRLLRVPPGFEPTDVQQLLTVLQEVPSC